MFEKRTFEYKESFPLIYEPPSLGLEKQAFDSMHYVNAVNGMGEVTNCQLVLSVPGPIYVFAVNIQKYHGGTEAQFMITGCLTFFRIDIPYEHDLETDAKERLLLYFGHLLLNCFCKPKFKLPFSLRKGLDRSKYEDTIETKTYFYDSIKNAIPSLGYSSIGDFMPVVKDLVVSKAGMVYLDGRYYQEVVKEPIDVDSFLNFHDAPADQTEPRLFSMKKA